MSISRTMAAFTIATLMGVVSLGAAANAQSNCDTYGKLALQQQKVNEASKCGFSGPEWSSDLKAHLAWCGGVGPDQWKVQLQNREQQLAQCKGKKS